MGKLIALIEGNPGSGKGHVCGQLEHRAGFAQLDLDDFTQTELVADDCDHFHHNMTRAARRVSAAVKKSKLDVVVCGVNNFAFEDFCDAQVLDGVDKIWLDISSRHFRPSRALRAEKNHHGLNEMSTRDFSDLLESTRRAVVREFKANDLRTWQNMTKVERAEEGIFWELQPPSTALSADEATSLIFDVSLNEFYSMYPDYMSAMLAVQVEDGVHLNRQRAREQGLIFMSPDQVIEYLGHT
jgi:hypothetical protein